VILEQFARLVTDLILVAPSYVLVIVTIYRLPSLLRRLKPIIFTRTYQSFDDVEMAFNREGRSEQGTEKAELCCFTRMQLWPMKSAGLILLDLLCSPLILLLLLTVYRFRAITLDLHGIRFHKAVVQQTCELLIDTPFVFAGVLVVCTLYRADLALLACRTDAQTAWERRLAVGKQFLRLVGDIASLIPFSFLVCTLYRICPLALNLKAQLVQLLREEPEMRLLEWRLSLPRPKGRPGFIVNAAKSANLHGITSMQLQVVGAEFWAAVAQARGGLVAAAGRAMLPLRLRHGKEVDFDVFKHGCTEVTLQLSVLTLLLIVTVVKLPDFLSSLRPSYGLRKLRDCALAAVSELVVGIGELLLMITAWKTYRLLVSAVIFAVLCPAAMLAMTLPPLMKNENRFQEVPVAYYQTVIKNCDKNVVMDQGQKVEKGTRCRLFVASLFWFVILFAGIWASAPYVLFCFDIILVLAFSGLCFNKSPGWVRPRGGMDWWSSVCRMTFPNLLAVTAILSEAVVLVLVGRSCMAEGWLEEKESSAGMDRFAIFAFSVVAAALLLETIPMVCNENEQISVVTSHAWRAGTMITKDVLLFPVVLVLSGRLSEHWLYSVVLLFYTVITLLSSAVWDVDLPYESLLDVRCSGLNMGGRRLLTMAAVQAGLSGNNGLFLSFMVASAAWTTMWAPFASSTPWAEVLRLGASAGGLAAATLGLFPTFLTWISAFIIGLLTAFGSWLLRKRALAASKIPSAMQHCVDMEKCLRLWGDTTLPRLRVDADVRSTARRVLEFEDRLPVERLDLDFFAGRHAWRSGLADAPDYETVLLHIERLKTAISVPVTRILVQQVLARMTLFGKRQLDRPLATEIAKFVVPPVDFKLPQPLKGWEFGDLDLAALRQHAEREAAKIPMLIRSKAARPTTIGRQAGPLLDFRF